MAFSDSLMASAAVLEEVDQHAFRIDGLKDVLVAGIAGWRGESIFFLVGEENKRVLGFFDNTGGVAGVVARIGIVIGRHGEQLNRFR